VQALLPAWRAERFIESTLDALAAQTYANLHILISDDASPDGTAALCEAFAARTPRTRLIRQARNLGWVGNTNALLHAAQGDYYFFALHDDLPHPRFVERMVEALEANPGATVAFSDLEQIFLDRSSGIRSLQNWMRLRAPMSAREGWCCGRAGGGSPFVACSGRTPPGNWAACARIRRAISAPTSCGFWDWLCSGSLSAYRRS
jgi:glycosyltransferase involved in cell wall biosynthesis